MIIGLLLAVAVSATLASLGLIILGETSLIGVNYATGAVIGKNSLVDASVTAFFVSLVFTMLLISIIKKRHS